MKKRYKIILIIFLIFIVSFFIENKVFAVDENKVIQNGIYEIEINESSKKVLDISGASKEIGANVQIWDKCNGKQQRFEFTYLNNGYYLIKNVRSGYVLDVTGALKKSGTNVQQWESNSTDAQKWKILKNEDGTYSIISKCNGLFLSVSTLDVVNGSNVEVYSKSDKKIQSFKFNKIKDITGTKTIDDGIYKISSALDSTKVIDISGASKLAGANVQVWKDKSISSQEFYISYDGKGFYTIKNVNSKKVLDVTDARTERGTNVWQWESNSTDAQKWVIQKTDDGYYRIISKVAGIYLEVAGSKIEDGSNIQINFESKKDNQKFSFSEVQIGTRTVKDGTYEITTGVASNMLVDVSSGSSLDGTNVQIWADANENQQKFIITYIGSGNYKIICKRTKKALTVAKTGTAYFSSVYQSTYTGDANQLWIIKKANDGKYYIISKYNYRYLDVAGANTANGTDIRVHQPNYTNAQTFLLEQKKYGIDVSHWQGIIDFKTLKNNDRLDFIIIRAGQATTIKDSKFETNYENSKKYNIPVGAYLYATAKSVEEAKQEANYFLSLIKGKQFELPIYYDVEAQEELDKSTITEMCIAFYNIIKSAGYRPGIYASKYYLLYKINVNDLPKDLSIWVASYGKNDGAMPKDTYRYNGNYDIWQYTSTGRIEGINGDVDFDVSFNGKT